MLRRRALFVIAALALLTVTISGAKPLVRDHVRLDQPGATLSTAHTHAGLTAMRHKSGGDRRSLLRAMAMLHQSMRAETVFVGSLLLLATLVVVRRQPRSALSLRGPPSFQI